MAENMRIKMELISDTVFGNGISVPGGENISLLCDRYGFPYYKGSTFKGVFREELARYLEWNGSTQEEISKKLEYLLGKGGDFNPETPHKLVFSDFTLSNAVKARILDEIGADSPEFVTDCLTHIRTFTKIGEDGLAADKSLRYCRCANKGLMFYSVVSCEKKDQEIVQKVLKLVKWIGSMRNRGFGKIKISLA